MKKIKIIILLSYCLLGLCTSCSSDEQITKENVPEESLTKVREFLAGEIVLSTKATLNGVDKTLLKSGCPTKFRFNWDETDKRVCEIALLGFTVGKMGMVINFKCNVQVMQLNSWEKDEYKGDGWIKFEGKNGSTFATGATEEVALAVKGSSIKGYYNTNTHQINFIVDYNMMNVRSECFMQIIDKTRISRYEEELKQFEKELEEYKKEHGLS